MRSTGKELPNKRERIEQLKNALVPLKRKYQEVYSYHHTLRQTIDTAEQEVLEREKDTAREVKVSTRLGEETQQHGLEPGPARRQRSTRP